MEQYSLNQIRSTLSLSGRYYWADDHSLLYLSYSCSAVEFSFTGSLLLCSLRAMCGWEAMDPPTTPNSRRRETWPVIGVILDNQISRMRKYEICQEDTIVLLQSLQPETHTVRIVKLTENLKTFVAVSHFSGTGRFSPVPNRCRRKMLVIGDSITCGFGNLSTDEKRGFYSWEEDSSLAYGSQAGALLDMDTELLCLSGTTLERHPGFLSPFCICDLYPYADRILEVSLGKTGDFLLWDVSQSPHDYVVVNIGTNDAYAILFGKEPDGEQAFEDAYYRFLKTLRNSEGPQAHIICALGPMQYFLFDRIAAAASRWIRDTGDQQVSVLKFLPLHPVLGVGAGGHPNAAAHKELAEQLARHIGGLMKHV